MITYLAGPSTGRVRDAMRAGQLGMLCTPRQGNRLPSSLQADVAFAIDNGCGPGADGGPGTGYPGDRKYLRLLCRMSAQARRHCLFATAPDVLCDAPATLAHLERWYPPVRAWFGLPVALVAQDGLEHLDVPWQWFDVLFIGGSTAWKLGPGARGLAAEAKARGKRVHMGRVNSWTRLAYAAAIGCDTADGGYLRPAPDVNLPVLLGWLSDARDDARVQAVLRRVLHEEYLRVAYTQEPLFDLAVDGAA